MEQERDSTITPGVLQDAIEILSGTRLPSQASPELDDVQLASELVLDMSRLFGMQSVPQCRSTVISGMSRVNPTMTLDWLSELEDSPPTEVAAVSLEDYVTVIQGFVRTQDEEGVKLVMNRARNHSALQPSAVLWQPYIKFLATATPDNGENFARLESALREMEAEGIPPTAPIISDVLLQCISAANPSGAERYCNALRELIEPESLTLTHSELCYAVAALVKYAGMCGGYPAAVEEAIALRQEGFQHNSHTMRALLDMDACSVFDAETLMTLADSLDIVPTPAVWAIVIKRALDGPDGLNAALATYNESKLRDVRPNSALVDPLIHALCSRTSSPSQDDVDRALDIYYDLRDAQSRHDRTERDPPPDRHIFMALLQGVSRSRTPSQTTSDLIIQLLIDMRYFQIKLHPSFIQNVFTSLLAISHSHDTAFKIWTYLREIDESVLTTTGYGAVLKQFAELSFDDDPLPSLNNYLEITQAMRKSGVTMTPYMYNVIFTRYARIAQSSSAAAAAVVDPDSPEHQKGIELRERILTAVKRLHLTLKIDAAVTPETATLNALMNAYNHLGEYQDAYDVWTELAYGKAHFDHTSVSIALDVCGFAGDAASADGVWRRVRGTQARPRHGRPPFVPSVNNWTSLIECRTRVNKYPAALAAFKEMLAAQDRSAIPLPDLKCAEVMLKCAKKNGDGDFVLKLIRTKLPDLFPAFLESNKNQSAE